MDPSRLRLPPLGFGAYHLYGTPSPSSTLPRYLHPWGVRHLPADTDPRTLAAAIEAAFQPASRLSRRSLDFASAMDSFGRWSPALVDVRYPNLAEFATTPHVLLVSVPVPIETVVRFAGNSSVGMEAYLAGQLAQLMAGLSCWREAHPESLELGHPRWQPGHAFGIPIPTGFPQGENTFLPRVILPSQPPTPDSLDSVYAEPNPLSAPALGATAGMSSGFGMSGRNRERSEEGRNSSHQAATNNAAALPTIPGPSSTGMPSNINEAMNNRYGESGSAFSRPPPGYQEGLSNDATGNNRQGVLPARLTGYVEEYGLWICGQGSFPPGIAILDYIIGGPFDIGNLGYAVSVRTGSRPRQPQSRGVRHLSEPSYGGRESVVPGNYGLLPNTWSRSDNRDARGA